MAMEIKNLISSGIIEIYCLGLASEEEIKLVEKFSHESKEVRDEIASVHETLNNYAFASSKNPPPLLKDKIINSVLNQTSTDKKIQFPPRLNADSTVSEWIKYISDNKIYPPENYGDVYLLDLPGNEKVTTYIAWANKGAVVEESHENEDEYLLMLKGRCSVTIDGVVGYYREGDIVFIPGKALHRAEVLSDEPMILVGQRLAA